jgi:phosphinothricin acetyltransferase
MRVIEDHAARAGHHALIGCISSANPGAVAFHAAQGFAEVGRLPQVGCKWDQWLDLIVMQKILRRPPDMPARAR